MMLFCDQNLRKPQDFAVLFVALGVHLFDDAALLPFLGVDGEDRLAAARIEGFSDGRDRGDVFVR